MTAIDHNFKATGIRNVYVSWIQDVNPLLNRLQEKGWPVNVVRRKHNKSTYMHTVSMEGAYLFHTTGLAVVWTFLWALAHGHVYDPDMVPELEEINEYIEESARDQLAKRITELEKLLAEQAQENSCDLQHELGKVAKLGEENRTLRSMLSQAHSRLQDAAKEIAQLKARSNVGELADLKAELAAMTRRYEDANQRAKMADDAREAIFGDYCCEMATVSHLRHKIGVLEGTDDYAMVIKR